VSVTDRKFAVKARLYQSLGVTLSVVRSFLHSPKVLQSLVSVLKLYAVDGKSVMSVLHSQLYRCIGISTGVFVMYLQHCPALHFVVKLYPTRMRTGILLCFFVCDSVV